MNNKVFTASEAKYKNIGERTQRTSRTQSDTIISSAKEKEKRFTVVLTERQVNYLNEKKWHERKTIKEVLRELIEEDIEKHPEYIKE